MKQIFFNGLINKSYYFLPFLFFITFYINAQEPLSSKENTKTITKSNGAIYIYKADNTKGLLTHGFGSTEIDFGDEIEFQIGFLDEFISEKSISFGLSTFAKNDSKSNIDYRVDLIDYGRNLKLFHGNTEKSKVFFPSNSTIKIKIDKYSLLYFLNNKLFLTLPRNSEDKYKIHYKILNNSNFIKGLKITKSKMNDYVEVPQENHEKPTSSVKSLFIRNLDGTVNIIKTDKLALSNWDSFGFGSNELETGNFVEFEFILNKDYASEHTSLQCGVSVVDKSNANSVIDYWLDLNKSASNVNLFYYDGTKFVDLKKEQTSDGVYKILVDKSHIVFYKNNTEIARAPKKADANFKFHYRIFDGYSGIKNLKVTQSQYKYWGLDFSEINPQTSKKSTTATKTASKKSSKKKK